jgi:glycine betaine catabolism B
MKKYLSVATYLDQTAMYRVVTHTLVGVLALVVFGSLLHEVPFTLVEIACSALVILVAVLTTSVVCGRVLRVPAQHESSLITGLLIFFLVMPTATLTGLIATFLIAVLAIASKYVLVIQRQHVCNPVAAGFVLSALFGFGGAAWWIATPFMLLPVVVLGSLVVTKVRQWPMVLTYIIVGFVVYLGTVAATGGQIATAWSLYFVSYPTLFLAMFMLTEPFTVPGSRPARVAYGAVAAFLINTSVLRTVVSMTPELALVLANVAFISFRLNQKLYLKLQHKTEITPNIYEFVFSKPAKLKFTAGQYLEWMLPHQLPDTRGIRRYFTIVSSPHESVLRLACKVPSQASTFKSALLQLQPDQEIIASQLAGDFILPKRRETKIGWVAGGIGITPFVSQATDLKLQGERRDIVLLYATATSVDQAYATDVQSAATLIPIVGTGEVPVGGESGYITGDMIHSRVPDFADRVWYVSGPPMMVHATKKALRTLKVKKRNIHCDFFPGLA